MTVALAIAVFLLAYGLVARFRRYALSSGRFLDVPNARSSHAVTTPRGGGLAIVVATLAASPILGWIGALTWPVVIGVSGAGAMVALVGIWDDATNLEPGWRLLWHFIAATWALAWLGGVPPLAIFGGVHDLGWMGDIVAAVFMVWLLNLTNFMDGIDGIVGIEIMSVCLGGAVLSLLVTGSPRLSAPPVVLAFATLGFLLWNWPPAKIFMGDAGSGFLGITVAAYSLLAGYSSPPLFWSWLILFGVFIVDADITLLRRLARGERVHEAHRSHAYQHAAVACRGHKRVVLAVGVLNVVWLFPLAAAVAMGSLDGRFGLAIAYAPLVVLALRFRAGLPYSPTRPQ